MASKRLKAALPLRLPHYEAIHGDLAEELRHKLLAMSAPTINRLLAPVRSQTGKGGPSGIKPGSLLKQRIPCGQAPETVRVLGSWKATRSRTAVIAWRAISSGA
jgi:hypothetical protein